MVAGLILALVFVAVGVRGRSAEAVQEEEIGPGLAWLGYRGNDLKGPMGRWAVLIDGIVPGSPIDLTGAACGDWIVAVETKDGWFSPRELREKARAGQWGRALLARPSDEGWLLWENWVRLGAWPLREPQYRCP